MDFTLWSYSKRFIHFPLPRAATQPVCTSRSRWVINVKILPYWLVNSTHCEPPACSLPRPSPKFPCPRGPGQHQVECLTLVPARPPALQPGHHSSSHWPSALHASLDRTGPDPRKGRCWWGTGTLASKLPIWGPWDCGSSLLSSFSLDFSSYGWSWMLKPLLYTTLIVKYFSYHSCLFSKQIYH